MTSELHKKFDVAARSLDLSSAIIKHDLVSLAMDMTSSAAADLIKWLARERISEAAFIHAMRLGQDLAEPNIRGLQIIDGLNKTASRLCGLQLVMPGSLGRTIMFDDQLRWIGTTVAVLLKYHLPITVTSILANLFISTAYPGLDDPRRDITDSRIRPVLFKVVDSVHLQVVNAGHESKPLPEALRAVRHYFASSKLAEIIKSIRDVGTAKTSVFVEMYGCVVDVIDWILHHWPGRAVISLDHSIVMDEQLGEEGSCLTLMIDTDCEPDTNIVNTILTGSSKPRPGVHVGVVSGFGAGPGSDRKPPVVPASSGRAEPRTRTGLYEFQNPFETIHMTLTERERRQAHLYAQEIVRSLVELPVEAMALGKWLVMKQVKDSKTKFSWWLKQTPSILQRNLGQPAKPRLLRVSRGTSGTKNKDPMQKHKASDVVGLYEELAAGVALVQERCECGGCKGDFVSDPVKGIATRAPVVATASLDSLNHGCLCTVMLMEMVLIIGHAMSEASGAVDVSQYSGKQGARGIAQVVMNVIGSVATKGEIRWESWLAMVSTFIGGVARDEVHDSATAQTNGLPRAKLQTLLHVVGSITIAPSWLVLESPLRLQGYRPSRIQPLKASKIRMAFIVQTDTAVRLFNPFDAFIGLIEAIIPECDHQDKATPIEVEKHTFAEVVQGWNSFDHTPLMTSPDASGAAVVAFIGASALKENIALAFSEGQCVLNRGTSCLDCIVDRCLKARAYGVCYGICSSSVEDMYGLGSGQLC